MLSNGADALSVRLQPQLAGSGWLGGCICYAAANAMPAARQAMQCAQAVLYPKVVAAASQHKSALSSYHLQPCNFMNDAVTLMVSCCLHERVALLRLQTFAKS